jgi:putative nucleotidyltransferase with HDIG domain
VGGNFGAIFLLEPETGDLVSRGWLAAGTGWQFAGDRTAALLRHRLGEGITGHVAATGEIHITFDLHNDPIAFILSGEADYASAVHGGISLPLRAQQQVVGVLHVWLAEPRSASDSEMRLLTAIAEMGGNAIHRATLHEQTLRHADELALAYDRTLEGWAHALELRDELTEGHTRRVTKMTLKLAAALGITEEQLVHVRRGALLHDIGKMGIPDSILLKPGPLTVIEMDIMRRHPQYAYNMLSPIPFLRPALDIPRYHHEKWDGTGYPRGLKGEQIPLAARIFAVADVWDALTFDRPYREAWPAEEVRQFIREQSGRHFDPQVAEAFLRLLNDRDLV